MKIGFLYAGQGSQHPGMGADFYEAYPAFRAVFDEAELDFDLRELCFQDPDGLLNQTRYTQPCMVAYAAGVTAVLKEKGIVPSVAAGLSLGEYSALCGAEVFDARTAVRIAAFRGAAMERAARGVDSAMMAVLGLERKAVEEACRKAERLGVAAAANFNCPGQIVIGGEKTAVEEAAKLCKEAGARRCLPLKVSGPFHTPLMAPAGEELKEYFKGISFGQQKIPVIFNCIADGLRERETIPELLVRQVQSSVYMEDSIRKMAQMADLLVEIGPGNALTGFVKKTLPGFPVRTVQSVEDLEALAREMGKEIQHGI